MPSIDIPAFKQPKDSVLCGPTCVRMILAHYGIKVGLKKIVSDMRMIKTGTYITDLGSSLLNYGFYTEVKFWLPGMEPQWFGTQDKNDLRRILKTKLRNIHRREWDACRGKLLKYVEAGGILKLEPIMFSDIQEEILAQRPLILSINSRVMDARGRADRGHFIAINSLTEEDTQCSKSMIGYIDPWDGQQHLKYAQDVIFYSHIWDGSALLIRQAN